MRLSTAAWLKPWLLDLKKVIRRRCAQPPRLGCAACQGWSAWEPSVTVVFSIGSIWAKSLLKPKKIRLRLEITRRG